MSISISTDPLSMGVVALSSAYRCGSLSPVDVAQTMLDRIAETHDAVNAFVHVDPETTLTMARAAEARLHAGTPLGPLDGIPVSIKDLVAVAGWPLVRGSAALAGSPPPKEDAPCVARLREAGAVFIGKTATPESGCRITTRSTVHGTTLNPWALDRTPGGSSGGASAALALGIGPLAVGTDGAGSIRIPAAWSGVFGIKPGFGRVPMHPQGMFMPHSVIGPLARDVASAAAMLEVMARPDPRDAYAWPIAFDAERASTRDVRGMRIGVTADFGIVSPPIDPAQAEAVDAAARLLAARGATVERAMPVWPSDPFESFQIFWEATYAGSLALTFDAEQRTLVDPELLAIARRGRAIGIERYHAALADRIALTSAARALFQRFDLLIGPVMPCGPPDARREAPPGLAPGDWRWCPFTWIWNMTGQPAASVPWGTDDDGLPLGVQLVGWTGAEELILRAAGVIENERGLFSPPPSSYRPKTA